jgi:DNA-binding response OmpR family regulator
MRRDPRISQDATLTVSDLVLNTDNRQVERAGQAIQLRKKEFDILEYLVRNRGRAVTRTMILNHVWEAGKESWNNTVDVHIKYLRDKVDKPFADKDPIIKTAYGIGYMVDNSE